MASHLEKNDATPFKAQKKRASTFMAKGRSSIERFLGLS